MDNNCKSCKTQNEINILLTTLELFNIDYSKVVDRYIYIHIYTDEDLEMIKKFLSMNNYIYAAVPENNIFIPKSRYFIEIDYYIKEE